MNNELQIDWNELVNDSKSGAGNSQVGYDFAIIAADELIKEQQAEIEHYKNQLDRVCEDGNTPADFDKLREANLALATESQNQQAHIERLRAGLEELAEQAAQVDGWESFPSAWLDSAYSVLSKQPAQSLEAVKREWQVEIKGNHALVLTNARRLIKAHKSTSNGRLCSEIFGMGCGSGRQYCRELGLDPDSNKTNFAVMIEFIEGHNND